MRILLLCVTLSGCSIWHPAEQRAFAFSMACHTYDVMQTDWAMEHGYVETNPLLGKHPSDNELVAAKAAALGLTWWAAEQFHGDDRWKVIVLTTLPCVAAVVHNHQEGVRP